MSSWLDDDPELLRAALEIVDNWADDALALGVESFSPNESDRADSSDDKSRKVSKNAAALRPVTVLTASTMASTHHRRRTEIKYLREVVAELESQLRQLEHRRGGPADEGPVVIARMWRDIAARQRQLRQEAESDRAKLRSLLNTQAKAAKALMEQLEKARSIECEQLLKPTKRSRVVPVPNMRPPEGSQFLVLERLYTRCDGLFAYSKFHDGTTKFADIYVNNEPNGDILIDLHETWVLPFGAAQVLDAMWEYTMRDYGIRWEQSGNEPVRVVALQRLELDRSDYKGLTHFADS